MSKYELPMLPKIKKFIVLFKEIVDIFIFDFKFKFLKLI